jgi:hypothetical protein
MLKMLLRMITAVTLVLAISSAVLLVALRLIHCFRPDLFPVALKSAVPLMLVGAAFGFFQFTASRTLRQVLLGLIVAAAFILWGTEQFLSNPAMVALIDDLVVFFFVLDLSVVIYGHLKPQSLSGAPELPFDAPESGR